MPVAAVCRINSSANPKGPICHKALGAFLLAASYYTGPVEVNTVIVFTVTPHISLHISV